MTAFITPHEALALHHRLSETYDKPLLPPRDPVMLELICARPQLAQEADATTIAAMLLEGILNNKPFFHLNTASGLAVLNAALTLNGTKLACSPAALQSELNKWRGKHVTAETIIKWLNLACEAI